MRCLPFALFLAVMSPGLAPGGAAPTDAKPPVEAVADLNADLFLGKFVLIDNVTVWPVYTKKPVEAIPDKDFLPLAEAQEKKLAFIRETGAPSAAPNVPATPNAPVQQVVAQADVGGQVNTLVIENRSDRPILVLAGTLLKGGKQDRQVGQDFIIAAGKTVPVDAFCVEHGRWTARREGAATAGQFQAQKSLGSAGVRGAAQFKGDQGEVWSKVAEENVKAGKSPSSGTFLATVDETDKEALARRERLKKAILDRFGALAKEPTAPLGLAYAVDGKIREVRTFSHPRIMERYVETLANTIALEGDLAQREALAKKQPIFDKPADSALVTELVKTGDAAKAEESKNKGDNRMLKRSGESPKAGKVHSNQTYEDDKAPKPATGNWYAE